MHSRPPLVVRRSSTAPVPTSRCPCRSFALFLNHLPDLHAQHPPDVLLQAVQKTIATIGR